MRPTISNTEPSSAFQHSDEFLTCHDKYIIHTIKDISRRIRVKFEASDEPIHLPKFEMPAPLFKDGKRSTVTVGARCEIPDMWQAITVYRRASFQPNEDGELTQDFDRVALALFRHTVREVFNYDGFPKRKGEWVDAFLANHQRKAHATMFGHLIWVNLMPVEANAAGPLTQPLSAASDTSSE